MKKILWIPQLATVDKKTGKIILDADSNITILNGIIDNLFDYKFYVCLPQSKFCNTKFENNKSNVEIVTMANIPGNAFSLRYDFNFEDMKNIIEVCKPDFIVNNTSTLTRNLKAVLFSLGNNKTKVINFMHFLDLPGENKVPHQISYFVRQIEGILCADLAVFQSYTVKDKAMNATKNYFDKKLIKFLNPDLKTAVWNATYSQIEIDETRDKFIRFDKKVIVFPNRLSSTNYSNHLRFFEAIRNISQQRNDFQVIVNNPTQYMKFEEIEELCPNLLKINDGKLMSKEQYFKVLNGANIGVALFTQEGHGGVSSKEFQAAGCLPVFPKVNEYQYLMPKHYKGFCKPDLNDLEKSLNYVLDVCQKEEGSKLSEIAKQLIYERDSFEYNSKQVRESLESLC